MNENKPQPDSKNTQSDSKKALSKPTWWNEQIDSSWKKASAANLEKWNEENSDEKLNDKVAEEALSFGYGARSAYPKISSWAGELEQKLKNEWKQVQSGVENTWERVHRAIKHGWEGNKNS